MSVCAVIVTRDRRALLVECLAALEAQLRRPDHILVIDNASSDGTAELLAAEYPNVETLTLTENAGGAGGFWEGMRRAHAAGHDWVWLMDDDTIPTPSALEALLQAAELPSKPPALLSSKTLWTDGRMHPMNYPGFVRMNVPAVVDGARMGLMPLRTATFVSLLVNRSTIDRFGLPLRRYFLWSDDIEYTARVLREAPGYFVPRSIVVHKTRQPYTAISTSGDRFYFHVRNTLYMLRGSAWAPREKPSLLFTLIMSLIAYGRFNRFAPRIAPIILRGFRDGLKRGAPTPQRP